LSPPLAGGTGRVVRVPAISVQFDERVGQVGIVEDTVRARSARHLQNA
jgi:hypothetical protein